MMLEVVASARRRCPAGFLRKAIAFHLVPLHIVQDDKGGGRAERGAASGTDALPAP
jgi:hypothetical protein